MLFEPNGQVLVGDRHVELTCQLENPLAELRLGLLAAELRGRVHRILELVVSEIDDEHMPRRVGEQGDERQLDERFDHVCNLKSAICTR